MQRAVLVRRVPAAIATIAAATTTNGAAAMAAAIRRDQRQRRPAAAKALRVIEPSATRGFRPNMPEKASPKEARKVGPDLIVCFLSKVRYA